MRIDQAGRSHLPEMGASGLIPGKTPRMGTLESGFVEMTESRQNVTGYSFIVDEMALYQVIEKPGLK